MAETMKLRVHLPARPGTGQVNCWVEDIETGRRLPANQIQFETTNLVQATRVTMVVPVAEMMRVRIRNGGQAGIPVGRDMIVEDMDTGKLIPVTRVDFDPITMDSFVTARLTVLVEDYDVVADASTDG